MASVGAQVDSYYQTLNCSHFSQQHLVEFVTNESVRKVLSFFKISNGILQVVDSIPSFR